MVVLIDGKEWWDGWWENPTAYTQYGYRGPDICCFRTADAWERWCGDTAWSRLMRRCGQLGATCQYWGGMPRSASAIPLTFSVYYYGERLTESSRLKDLRSAVAYLENVHKSDVREAA